VSETIGSLVDKISITNVKLFMIQDMVHRAAAEGEALDAPTVARLHALNQQRNKLLTELDQLFADSLKEGEAEVDPRPKI